MFFVWNSMISYNKQTGGALSVSATNFTNINGFSNKFWGWGHEDNDLYDRYAETQVSQQSEQIWLPSISIRIYADG